MRYVVETSEVENFPRLKIKAKNNNGGFGWIKGISRYKGEFGLWNSKKFNS